MPNNFRNLNDYEYFCPSCLFRCHHITDLNKHLMEKHLVQIPFQLIGFNQNRNFNNSQHKSNIYFSNFQSIENQKIFSYLSKLIDNKCQPHQAFCNSIQPLTSSTAFLPTESKNVSEALLKEYLNTLLVLQGRYDNHLVNGTNNLNLKSSPEGYQNCYLQNSLQQKLSQQYPDTPVRRENEVSCSENVQNIKNRSVDFVKSHKQQDLDNYNPAKVRAPPTDNLKRNQSAHKKSLELHILKLISDNEKVLTNPNFEKVKPRRVLRQGSLDSNYLTLTNDSVASSQHNSFESFKNSYNAQLLSYQTSETNSTKRNLGSNGRRTAEALKPIKFLQCLECGVRYRKEANYNAHKQFYCQYRKKPLKTDNKRLNGPQKLVNAVHFADDQSKLTVASNHNHLYSTPKYSESHFQTNHQSRNDLENTSLKAKSYFLKHMISLNGKREITENTRLLDGLDLSLSSNLPRNNYKVLLHRLNLQNMQDIEIRKKTHQEKLAIKRSLHHESYIPSKYSKVKSSLSNKDSLNFSANYFYEKNKLSKTSSKAYKLEEEVLIPSSNNSISNSSNLLISNPTKCASNIRIKSSINQQRFISSNESSKKKSLKFEDLLNGHLQPTLNPKLQTSFCSLINPQPNHVEIKNETEKQLSMYSQWQTVKPFLPFDLHITELLSSWRCPKRTRKSTSKSPSLYHTAGSWSKPSDLIITDSKDYHCKKPLKLSLKVSVSRYSTDSGIMLAPVNEIQPNTSKPINSIKSITLSGDNSSSKSSKCEVSLSDSNQSSSSTGFSKHSRVKKLRTRRERATTFIYFKNSKLKNDCECNCKHRKKSKESTKKFDDGTLLSNNSIKINKGTNNNEEKSQASISSTTLNYHKDVITTTNSKLQTSHNRIFSTRCKQNIPTHTFNGSINNKNIDKMDSFNSNLTPYKCIECKLSFKILDHLAMHLRSKSHANTIQKLLLEKSGLKRKNEMILLDERLNGANSFAAKSILNEPQKQKKDENIQRNHKNKEIHVVDMENLSVKTNY